MLKAIACLRHALGNVVPPLYETLRERCGQADRAIASGGRVSHRTILLLEDETNCQVEFHDLCVHRSLKGERL
ncbi:hypothetical protein [Nostoc sp. C110]|uniref:hypothetical protein n=1 Tax=Nostoc sp. C110 TaxID=3349876 RepID=UPI00370D1CCC